MRLLRWLGCLSLALIGLALLVPGLWIALSTDWQPTKELHESERVRIRAAQAFVEAHKAKAGRLPRLSEFEQWARTAPSDLRIDGVGFSYQEGGRDWYVFSWWGGNATLSWKSNYELARADISPQDYFLFGDKLFDLLVFFGLAAAAFWGAKRMAPTFKGSSAS